MDHDWPIVDDYSSISRYHSSIPTLSYIIIDLYRDTWYPKHHSTRSTDGHRWNSWLNWRFLVIIWIFFNQSISIFLTNNPGNFFPNYLTNMELFLTGKAANPSLHFSIKHQHFDSFFGMYIKQLNPHAWHVTQPGNRWSWDLHQYQRLWSFRGDAKKNGGVELKGWPWWTIKKGSKHHWLTMLNQTPDH